MFSFYTTRHNFFPAHKAALDPWQPGNQFGPPSQGYQASTAKGSPAAFGIRRPGHDLSSRLMEERLQGRRCGCRQRPWEREERAFQPWQHRRTASAIMSSWLQEVSTWLRHWYEVIESERLPVSPRLPRPPGNDSISFSQRYPPSSSAAPEGCVLPAFPGGRGSRWLHGTGYSLRPRVMGPLTPRVSAVPQ